MRREITYMWGSAGAHLYPKFQLYAEIYHCRRQIKYSKDKMWYLAKLIRGMSIDQAVAQMEFSDKKGAKIIKEVLLEAQDMAVRDHNVEFRSNLYIVLPLDVDSVLSHKSLRIVLDHCIAASREVHCIAASREVHYIQLYHSVYQSLCTVSSWVCSFYSVSSIPIEFFQFIILLSTIVFYHQQKPQFVSQSKGIPSFSNFLPLQRAVTINIFV
ncbi:39S ribosomal protein L22, mitochondrial isoform X4 [Monodelphis domestica]|uniref:39S ribosomal protein L22, mitochondrial isoform X4 n=1 Tax=Monodelphis domestica TaxID=13616 RepID=UPI0024E23D21|nr:39S ribosomal protein L22, mitochondrial isoform X4 [Monodelphis domestica]